MINGDRGEGNLDDDYDIIDGADIEHHTQMDDIMSLEEEEDRKKDSEHSKDHSSHVSPKKEIPQLSQEK
jgi:hypothetical protein